MDRTVSISRAVVERMVSIPRAVVERVVSIRRAVSGEGGFDTEGGSGEDGDRAWDQSYLLLC